MCSHRKKSQNKCQGFECPNCKGVILPSILALNRDDEELTGSEDPSVLHSVVANLPVQQAYKEGKKKLFGGTSDGIILLKMN